MREDKLQGFKAGALRLALTQTAPDAEIIGVIDADYIVTPDWLTNLVPVFADPKVGLIQAPQDHRDGDRSVMHYAMQGEYSGFFDIGMVQRNEKNAIIVHGTMCLMRRSALDAAGNWSSDTICEDTDLGLTMIELGWQVHYTNRRYGFGLLPDTFEAFKKQRHRWAYGGVQIVKKHWRRFLPGVSQLSREQRREFTLGWLVWLGAESLGVVVAILNLHLGAGRRVRRHRDPRQDPDHSDHRGFRRRGAAFRDALSPARADQQEADARRRHRRHVGAMDGGARGRRRPDQGAPALHPHRQGRPRQDEPVEFHAFWEAVLGGLLVLGAIVVLAFNTDGIQELTIFAVVLMLQSLPFLSAASLAAIEGSRLNEFATWRELQTKALVLLPKRAAAMAEVTAPAEKQPETIQ